MKKLEFSKNVELDFYTTVGIGGLAENFVITRNSRELKEAVEWGQEKNMPITIIGRGSNSLISDSGIKDLVIANLDGEVDIMGDFEPGVDADSDLDRSFWKTDDKDAMAVDYDEAVEDPNVTRVSVKVDSGVNLQPLIQQLINEGITGLQMFAGIPGTIGGAVFNNIHGGSKLFSDYVDSVEVLTSEGSIEKRLNKDLDFGYDKSLFQNSNEIILSVVLNLYKGNVKKAHNIAIGWRNKKLETQPQKTLGCVFANLSEEEAKKLDMPTTSAGYFIDKMLNLGGYKMGMCTVSSIHSNFIEVTEGATAEDYLAIVKLISDEAYKQFNIELRPEIRFLGFEDSDLEDLHI